METRCGHGLCLTSQLTCSDSMRIQHRSLISFPISKHAASSYPGLPDSKQIHAERPRKRRRAKPFELYSGRTRPGLRAFYETLRSIACACCPCCPVSGRANMLVFVCCTPSQKLDPQVVSSGHVNALNGVPARNHGIRHGSHAATPIINFRL